MQELQAEQQHTHCLPLTPTHQLNKTVLHVRDQTTSSPCQCKSQKVKSSSPVATGTSSHPGEGCSERQVVSWSSWEAHGICLVSVDAASSNHGSVAGYMKATKGHANQAQLPPRRGQRREDTRKNTSLIKFSYLDAGIVSSLFSEDYLTASSGLGNPWESKAMASASG